jgi:hypothetical protein
MLLMHPVSSSLLFARLPISNALIIGQILQSEMPLHKDVYDQREMINKAIANLTLQKGHGTEHVLIFNGTKHLHLSIQFKAHSGIQ